MLLLFGQKNKIAPGFVVTESTGPWLMVPDLLQVRNYFTDGKNSILATRDLRASMNRVGKWRMLAYDTIRNVFLTADVMYLLVFFESLRARNSLLVISSLLSAERERAMAGSNVPPKQTSIVRKYMAARDVVDVGSKVGMRNVGRFRLVGLH